MAKTKKRYKIMWVCRGGYEVREENPLTEKEAEQREGDEMFYSTGRPKDSFMKCKEKGMYKGSCVGNGCPFYADQSCDQHGCEWN